MSNEDNTEMEILAEQAAALLASALKLAEQLGAPYGDNEAAELHNDQSLFPQLRISTPRHGGKLHVLLAFCEPDTGRPKIDLFEVNGKLSATGGLH